MYAFWCYSFDRMTFFSLIKHGKPLIHSIHFNGSMNDVTPRHTKNVKRFGIHTVHDSVVATVQTQFETKQAFLVDFFRGYSEIKTRIYGRFGHKNDLAYDFTGQVSPYHRTLFFLNRMPLFTLGVYATFSRIGSDLNSRSALE